MASQGADTNAKPGADTNAKPGADTEAKPGADTKAKPGADTEAKPGVDMEAKPGADTEANPGTNTEANPGTDTEANPGTNTEAKPGVDAEAKPLQFLHIEGCDVASFFCPMEPALHFQAIKAMQVRPDDVFICAYPKAGTHWTWEMTSMLLRGSTEHDSRSKINAMLEFIKTDVIDAQPSPRALNSHLPFRFLPWQLREKGARVVVVSRNPKDVAVSWFHHSKGLHPQMEFKGDFASFIHSEFFFNFGVFGLPFFEYELDWEKVNDVIKDLNILFLKYEDMKEDPVAAVRQLNDFLGTGASESLMADIAAACDFRAMRQADGRKRYDHDGFFTPEFLAKSGLYRKGEVGDWKNWFTVAMSERFDQVQREKLQASRLSYRFSL